MKGFLVVIVLLLVGIAGLGFYRGWFTVNQNRILEDKDKVQQLGQEVKKEAGDRTDKVKEQEHRP